MNIKTGKYIKKITSSLIVVLVLFSLLTAMPTSAVTYTNSSGTIKVKCGSYSHTFNAKNYGKNFSRTLNYALEVAARKASDKSTARVTVTKGNYIFDRTIYIYSNTILDATGSSFRITRDCMLRNGFDKFAYSGKGYGSAHNITIKGGTWDMNLPYKEADHYDERFLHTTMRFGHCNNIVIKEAAFKNNYNCHDIELGGVSDAVITNCSFVNSKNVNGLYSDGGKEAIQIDVNTSVSVPYFPSYDYTPCKNITIKNNSFKNKFRAIGSHHGVVGNTYDNISVHHNNFDNIAGFTIYGVYWTNAQIYSNTFTNVGNGIDIRPMIISENDNLKNYNRLSYLTAEYVSRNSTTYIYDNRISVRKSKNTYASPFGIRVMGAYLPDSGKTSFIKAGRYDAHNIKIGINKNGTSKPNTISGNITCGVSMIYGNGCNVENNIIDLSQSICNSAYGVIIKGSRKTTVANNTITEGQKNNAKGIYIAPSSDGIPSEKIAAVNNTISDFSYSGITVADSTNISVYENKITNSEYGITLKGTVNASVEGNTTQEISQNAIYSYSGSTGTKITNNNLSSENIGIFLNDKNDPIIDEEKTLSITGNVFNCPKNITPVSLVRANMCARVYDNFMLDNSYAPCRIKGSENDKYTYCYQDFAIGELKADCSNNKDVIISLDMGESPLNYRIYRTIYSNDTQAITETNEDVFIDTGALKYMSDHGIIYQACPYISSSQIKLLGQTSNTVEIFPN